MGKKEAHKLDKKIKTKQAAIDVFPSTNAGTDLLKPTTQG